MGGFLRFVFLSAAIVHLPKAPGKQGLPAAAGLAIS
jgi:hypothetical protein